MHLKVSCTVSTEHNLCHVLSLWCIREWVANGRTGRWMLTIWPCPRTVSRTVLGVYQGVGWNGKTGWWMLTIWLCPRTAWSAAAVPAGQLRPPPLSESPSAQVSAGEEQRGLQTFPGQWARWGCGSACAPGCSVCGSACVVVIVNVWGSLLHMILNLAFLLIHTRLHAHTQAHTHTHIQYTHACTHTTHARTHTHTYIHTYTLHTHMHAHILGHTHTNTHTHIANLTPGIPHCALHSSHSYVPTSFQSDRHVVQYWLVECMIWVIQNSGDENCLIWLHLGICHHDWLCTIDYLQGFLENLPVFGCVATL